MKCPRCSIETPAGAKFCNECGYRLDQEIDPATSDIGSEGERKHVTVLFSDLSGYTAMSERLDPEEVKEITGRIFGEISKIIANYDGFVEKYAGDAVMALFGANKSHEDDPIRAIRAAIEIHARTEKLSPEFEGKIESPLQMHTGIHTGLVVTGDLNVEKGIHGVAGDTVNVASRLSTIAKPEEILIGPVTYNRSEGQFNFETMETVQIKGKAEPIQIYKFTSIKNEPRKIHRLHGLRSELIGRKAEMAQLTEAVSNLRNGKGMVFSVIGAAGTGKSRLVEEFKATLDLDKIQWREGLAYPYSQNIPYFPLINLINRTLQIKEADPSEKVREKIELGIESLIGEGTDVAPYVGSLYSLDYPETKDVSPEYWKSKLQKSILKLLSSLAQSVPTVICLEDLHWADPSTFELVHFLLSELRPPVLFLCVYRPIITLFSSNQIESMVNPYHELLLQDLSSSEVQRMVKSLLRTEAIPADLQHFIRIRVEGNPFYLEEVINSLIESKVLLAENGNWKLTQPMDELEISSTIHGVISARVDRLKREAKRILQEAAVIGRAFYYEILKRITELKGSVDKNLSSLERFDFIEAKTIQPDLEYIFKHAVTQEVVYNGLLKKERQVIHERIGFVMEQLFEDRVSEFYETLSFHFMRGKSLLKAIDYLIKSGEKSFKKYAVEESHQYYKKAFELINNKTDKTEEDKEQVIETILKWAYVYNYRGDFNGLNILLSAHKDLFESMENTEKVGMFYVWLSNCLFVKSEFQDSYYYISKALAIGQEIGNQKIIAYAYDKLTWICTEMGLLREAVAYGEKAQLLSKLFEADSYLFLDIRSGSGYAYFRSGEGKKAIVLGKAMIDYGRKHSSKRNIVAGHFNIGCGYLVAGKFISAIEMFQEGIYYSQDPFHAEIIRLFLGVSYIVQERFQEAEIELEKVLKFSQDFGIGLLATPAHSWLGVVHLVKGHMSQGLHILEESIHECKKTGRNSLIAHLEFTIGKVYMQLLVKEVPFSLLTILKNIGFVIKNVPFAGRKAENHIKKAIIAAKNVGDKGILGQAHLELGRLHIIKNRIAKAQKCLTEAIKIFEETEAEGFLKESKEELLFLHNRQLVK